MRWLFLIVLVYNTSFAQSSSTIVEYESILDEKGTNNRASNFLIISQNETLYLDYGRAGIDYKLDDVFNDQFDIKRIGYLILKEKNSYFVTGLIPTVKHTMAEDKNLPSIKWKILPDYKEILGFACKKAEGKFRGRTWVVWFAPKVPESTGPWKLSGLPGLILEGKTINGMDFQFKVKRILLDKKVVLPQKILEYINKLKQKLVSFKEFVAKENDFLIKNDQEIRASIPLGAVIIDVPQYVRMYEKELQFEWEKEPLKY